MHQQTEFGIVIIVLESQILLVTGSAHKIGGISPLVFNIIFLWFLFNPEIANKRLSCVGKGVKIGPTYFEISTMDATSDIAHFKNSLQDSKMMGFWL